MPDVSGENLVPQGRAGTGAAYILGANVPSALSVIINGQRSRDLAARQAAALKLKQEQDAAKDLDNSLKYGTKGGALYQNALNSRVFNGLSDKLVAVERERMAGKIDMYTAKQQQATLKRNAEDEQTLSLAKQTEYQDGYKAVQADSKGRDATAYNVGYQGSLTRKGADGQQEALLPSEHDNLAAMQAQDNNPLTYVADEQIRRSVQGLQQSTLADAHAGLIGGTHGANTLTYKGIVVDRQKDGSFAPRMEGGRPVVDVNQADMERDRGGNHGLDMGIKRMEMNDATLAVAEGRAPKDALTLYKEGLGKYVNFRQTEAEGRNAQVRQPRAAAKGGGASYIADSGSADFSGEGRYDAPTTEAGTVPYSVPGVPGMAPIVAGAMAADVPRQDFATYGNPLAAPSFRKKSGEVVNLPIEGFLPDNIQVRNGKGVWEQRQYTGQPLTGVPEAAHRVFIDPKTKRILTPKTKQEGADKVRSGEYGLGIMLDFAQHSNKNYANDLTTLTDENLTAQDNLGRPKYPQREQAEAAARKTLEGGMVRSSHLYTPKTAASIDGRTGGVYAKYHNDLMAELRRLRAEGPQQAAATKPKDATGGAYPRKATTTSNQNKDTKPGRAGAY